MNQQQIEQEAALWRFIRDEYGLNDSDVEASFIRLSGLHGAEFQQVIEAAMNEASK